MGRAERRQSVLENRAGTSAAASHEISRDRNRALNLKCLPLGEAWGAELNCAVEDVAL